MLIHKRAPSKYHSGELWTNACCSHPRPGEDALAAATRRLDEEMGVRCALAPLFKTHYRAEVSNGCIEDEMVHAFGGTYDGPVRPDPLEATEWKWIGWRELVADRTENPDRYTVWFKHYIDDHGDAIARWLKDLA
jgi:isopentenyl-diphosphate delta-isomerase